MKRLDAYKTIAHTLLEEATLVVRFVRARLRRRLVEAQLRYHTARKGSLRR